MGFRIENWGGGSWRSGGVFRAGILDSSATPRNDMGKGMERHSADGRGIVAGGKYGVLPGRRFLAAPAGLGLPIAMG